MNHWRAIVLSLFCSVLLACAGTPQQTVYPSQAMLTGSGTRIGIAMTAVPKPDTSFPGAGCLLCYAAASALHTRLTSYAQSIAIDEFRNVDAEVAEAARRAGATVVPIDVPIDVSKLSNSNSSAPNTAKKDFRALREIYQVDKLLVIQIDQLGFERPYATYVPSGDPKAVVRGSVYLVDLSNNSYEWYQTLAASKGADGAWDEPPKYPGLTNAFYQAWETVKDTLLQPFSPAAANGTSTPVTVPTTGLLMHLQHGTPPERRGAAQRIVREHIVEQELLDEAKAQLLAGYKRIDNNDLDADVLAWMCHALASTAKPEYLALVSDVHDHAADKKVRDYAGEYLKMYYNVER